MEINLVFVVPSMIVGTSCTVLLILFWNILHERAPFVSVGVTVVLKIFILIWRRLTGLTGAQDELC